jgi:DNA repair exonuclease SbcCD ATPase subunit
MYLFRGLAVLLCALSFGSQPSSCKTNSDGIGVCTRTADARVQSARAIIMACNRYQKQTTELIAQLQKDTNQAVKLRGDARRYESKLAPRIKPLIGAKLAAAKRMYKSDLDQFAEHARAYREHNVTIRHHYGECAASRAAYERNKNSYLLHGKEFHMEDIPPPHICKAMQVAMDDATKTSGELRDSAKRLVDAQINLMKTEARLNAAEQNSESVNEDVRTQQALNLQEQDLAAEFARLKEEYRQLDVARKALSASGVRNVVPTVHATVRH